jgi:hypothetical protein
MAIAGMALLRRRGLRVPDDVRVTGFNGLEFWRYASPPLTTVFSPASAIGETAAEAMLRIPTPPPAIAAARVVDVLGRNANLQPVTGQKPKVLIGMATDAQNRALADAVGTRRVWVAAALFAGLGLLLQGWRMHSLSASYDQGIFTQVLWNGLHGHPFESTLSSQLSTNVIHGGEAPALGYRRLGQHFTPLLALWIPLVGLGGAGALGVIQVGLITAAGLVLHRLARQWLPEDLAAMVGLSFFGANAVLGPTWGNFTDLCQLPLLVFLLLLALETRSRGLGVLAALLIPLVREDTGVVLAGIGVAPIVQARTMKRVAHGGRRLQGCPAARVRCRKSFL